MGDLVFFGYETNDFDNGNSDFTYYRKNWLSTKHDSFFGTFNCFICDVTVGRETNLDYGTFCDCEWDQYPILLGGAQ